MTVGDIWTVVFPQFLEGARRQGIDVRQLLLDSGLSADLLDPPFGRVSFEEFSRLSRNLIRSLQDETYGLFDVPQSRGMSELLVLALLHRATVEEALERLAALSNRRRNGLHHQVNVSGNACEYIVRWDLEDPPHINEFAIESLLLWRHRLLCWLSGTRIDVKLLRVPHSEPPWAGDYCQLYPHAKVLHRQPHASITFDRMYLACPLIREERELTEILGMAFSTLPPAQRKLQGLPLQVRDVVFACLRDEHRSPSLREVSQQLKVKQHSLHRLLKKDGITFKEVAAAARQEYAMILLRQPGMSIEEIAENLGYLEVSSFSRAFKEWTGLTPRSYRTS